ncbi:hypothetical protein PHYSODRAFT_349334 [Phytophthora sojae]|uniref:CTLH domain-containing protein n=1 Tax=Phytophthora sojae (strain P6497) TaxID=1094619 RepID=G4YKV1_PHYSP|nr:hypothetical protein PHYSODRAFT_349334 [Phytophthora sojae]EGZ29443.1 hypothetical protein PHYSODRAFT_349334 [Phytophthora sojae]|eukprot:XP_009516718.1 hypothetical protein PHYSODRAFT_349334 [Phytophthora sojae]
MEKLQSLMGARQWDEALRLVTSGPRDADAEEGAHTERVRMKSPQATREAALLLLRRKFIDLLLQRRLPLALRTFQEQILPVYRPSEAEVAQLAQLLLCRDEDEMKRRAQVPWQDEELQRRIEALVSPEEIIPEGALRRLVQDGSEMDLQVAPPMLAGKVTGNCVEVLTQHKTDVWELAFSPDGQMLASASSDGSVVLWQIELDEDAMSYEHSAQLSSKPLHVLQSLEGPADCLAWSPDSRFLLSSGSRSSTIQLWDRMSGLCEKRFQHPGGVVTKMRWLPCAGQFVSGSADKSLVLWNADESSIIYQWSGRRVLDVVVHPHESKVFVLISAFEIRAYDVALRSDELLLEAEHAISCLNISSSGRFLLMNLLKQEQVVCVEVATGSVIAKYRGIREQRYVLRPCFVGAHSELVACGSEDGKVYVWQRDSGKRVTELDGHSSVVNVVARHPVHSNVIASASDDETLWSYATATTSLSDCELRQRKRRFVLRLTTVELTRTKESAVSMHATYDTWQRATSVEHFQKLARGE